MLQSLSKKELLILFTGLILLVVIVMLNPLAPFSDERLYLLDVKVLHQYGFGTQFLLNLTGSAGPLYAIVHYSLEPLTQLHQPYIRLVNIGFLFGMMFFLGKTLSLLDVAKRSYGLYCAAIPMTYVTAGLALTEMPAMSFFSVGLYLAIRVANLKMNAFIQFFHLTLGGVCISLAIVGRQPYLVTLLILPILFIGNTWRDNIWKVSVLLFFSALLPSYIFWVWQDLVPPTDALLYNEIAKAGTSLRPDFSLLCLAYFSATFFFIQPDFYFKPSKKGLTFFAAIYCMLLIFNYFFKWIVYLPFEGVMSRVLRSLQAKEIAGNIIGATLAITAFHFLFTLAVRVFEAKFQKNMLFYSIGLVLIALSCSKITWGFSSRYAAQAIPLLVPMAAYYRKEKSASSNNSLAGVLIGLASLLSYLLLGK